MTKRIKFPTFSSGEKLKLIFGPKSRPIEIEDTGAVRDALMNGRFVLAWDKENAADDYPIVGALKAVTQSRCGEVSYTVLCEGGYESTYKHALLIDSEELPLVVTAKRMVCDFATIGRFVGCFTDFDGNTFCTIENGNGRGYGLYYFAPECIAYHSDVNFGIFDSVEGDNGNN
jgi:hypothetical protein